MLIATRHHGLDVTPIQHAPYGGQPGLPGTTTPGATRTVWLTDEEIASFTSKGVTMVANSTVNSATDMNGYTRYRDTDQNDNPATGVETISADANWTFTPARAKTVVFAGNGTLSAANRTVTIQTTGATVNSKHRIVYKAGITGSFNLAVGALKTLTAGQWCDIEFDGTNFILTGFGSL